MKYDGLSKKLGWYPRYSVLRERALERLLLGARDMASGGHLLGLQRPPVPSHLSDFMPACVRATHNGDAKDCSSLSSPNVPLQPPRSSIQGATPASSSTGGLIPFGPLPSRFGGRNEIFAEDNSLERTQSSTSRSSSGIPSSSNCLAENDEVGANVQGTQACFASSVMSTDQNEIIRQADKRIGKKVVTTDEPMPYPPSVWVPYFHVGYKDEDARASNVSYTPSAESPPPTPPGEDMLARFRSAMGKEIGESSCAQAQGIGSKLSSMLSLEKRVSFGSVLSNGFPNCSLNEMTSLQSSSSTTGRASLTDSRVSNSNTSSRKHRNSFSYMFECAEEVEKDNFYPVPRQGGVCGGRLSGEWDACSKADLAWMEACKKNGDWTIEPWQSEQRKVLLRTLHIMRCDIESLKVDISPSEYMEISQMMLRALEIPAERPYSSEAHLHNPPGGSSLMDRVVSNTTVTSEMKRSLGDPSCDEGFGISIHQRNVDRELLSAADVCNLENEDGEGNNGSGPIDNRSRIGPKKQKQWWRELLTALGLTVWVIAGAVFVAKVIGVPNLGVTNVAYNGWGRSEDDDTEPPLRKGASGVVELSSYTFSDVVKKRPTFVMFYAPWCPHCQRLHPTWTKLAGVLSSKEMNVQLAIVDATKHTRLADKYQVPGFPTLLFFKNGNVVGRHRGARDIDTLLDFVSSNL